MSIIKKLCIFVFVIVLSSCSEMPSQSEDDVIATINSSVKVSSLPLSKISEIQSRLYRISMPILINNQYRCKKFTRPILGIGAKNKYSYSTARSGEAQNTFGFDDVLQVTDLAKDAKSMEAGLRIGDKLLRLENQDIPRGNNAEVKTASMITPLIMKQSSIKFTVSRNGENFDVNIPTTLACAFRVELGYTDMINSFSDGQRIMITKGMIDFVRNDDELAYVIAKEVAHNALNHPAKMGNNTYISDLINLLRVGHISDSEINSRFNKIIPFDENKDVIADRLALHLLVGAGYNIEGVANFWKRVSEKVSSSDKGAFTANHPYTKKRLDAIKKTARKLIASQEKRKLRKKR